ncbi:hypothetical protein CEXT_27761, partial [Caerostris extrusa]
LRIWEKKETLRCKRDSPQKPTALFSNSCQYPGDLIKLEESDSLPSRSRMKWQDSLVAKRVFDGRGRNDSKQLQKYTKFECRLHNLAEGANAGLTELQLEFAIENQRKT